MFLFKIKYFSGYAYRVFATRKTQESPKSDAASNEVVVQDTEEGMY